MVEATNRLSLIGRPLNPRVQNLNAVIAALPRVWEPWIFNNWFVASTRWDAAPALNFLWRLLRNWGEIVHLDFHEATTTQIAYIRVRVRFGITDRLRFFQRIIFDSGETTTIRFQYERLRRICSSCFRITHNREYCPYRQRPHSIARERAMFRDTVMRSTMNSQSSDD
ncbi:hypothetical protein AtEden1_Chr00c002g0322611 [Arabidopsis thaliana]